MDANPTITIHIPTECVVCRCPIGTDWIVPETMAPGFELVGDPARILGWCAEHVPDWARIYTAGLGS